MLLEVVGDAMTSGAPDTSARANLIDLSHSSAATFAARTTRLIEGELHATLAADTDTNLDALHSRWGPLIRSCPSGHVSSPSFVVSLPTLSISSRV